MDGFEELSIELTDRCPLRCLHCSSMSGPACKNQLSRKTSLQLVEEAAAIGAMKISFGGGEPTVADHFIDILTKVNNMGMHAEVFTCGISLQDNRQCSIPDDIVNYCGELKQVKFIFSIHGATPDIHERATQTPCSFEYLNESIEKCLRVGIECETNFVPTKINVHQFKDIVEFNRKYGLKKLSILRFVPQGRGIKNQDRLELSRAEEDQFVELLLNMRQYSDIDIRTGSPFNNIVPYNNVPCRAGISKLVVQANGNVLPCEVYKHISRHKWNLSVYRQSINQILNSPSLISLRNSLKRSDCLNCPIHSFLRANQQENISHEKVPTSSI